MTDLVNGRIYLPPASIPGGHGLRSLALQATAHRVLEHEKPASYTDFLRQRLEFNYFAAACLMPRTAAVEFLSAAKAGRDLAVEDFRDAFGVTHEAAAQRLTNLATSYLEIPIHFLRVGDDGALYRGYENDGVPFPQDGTGAIEGQPVCRWWTARSVFGLRYRNRELPVHRHPGRHLLVLQPDRHADRRPVLGHRWRAVRACEVVPRPRDDSPGRITLPGPRLLPAPRQRARRAMGGPRLASASLHAHVLAPLPTGSFPGVDDVEVIAFLERHSTKSRERADQ